MVLWSLVLVYKNKFYIIRVDIFTEHKQPLVTITTENQRFKRLKIVTIISEALHGKTWMLVASDRSSKATLLPAKDLTKL